MSHLNQTHWRLSRVLDSEWDSGVQRELGLGEPLDEKISSYRISFFLIKIRRKDIGMSVQNANNFRSEAPSGVHEIDEISAHPQESSWTTCWSFGSSEACLSAMQENMNVKNVSHFNEMGAVDAVSTPMNILMGAALIVTNALYLANVHQREQALWNCRQDVNCTLTHHSYAGDLVLKSGVAPQETSAVVTGMVTGVILLGYGVAKIGMIIFNHLRNP